MSTQSVVCDRCHTNPKLTICEICHDLGEIVNLCGGCFSPHFRLMHGFDPNSGSEVGQESVITPPRVRISFAYKLPTPNQLRKKKPDANDKIAIKKYITEHLK